MTDELRRLDRGVPEYYYRRDLAARELLPAVGVAVGVGVAAFYLARLFAQRTPLSPPSPPHPPLAAQSRQRPRQRAGSGSRAG